MPVTLIIFSIFLLVMITVILFFNKSLKLDKVQYGTDERILYEEYPVTVKDKRSNSSTSYPNSKVMITNYRIILAQKILFSDNLTVNCFINYIDAQKLNAQAMKGVNRVYNISLNDVNIEESPQSLGISIKIKRDLYTHTIAFNIKDKNLGSALRA